jgi:hypothetical protein
MLRLPHCLNLFLTQFRYISWRRSLTADTQRTLLLLRFKFTNQSKVNNNTYNGLLQQEGDFHSRYLSSNCCLHAIMKNLYVIKNSTVENGTIWRPVFSLLENEAPPSKKRHLATMIKEENITNEKVPKKNNFICNAYLLQV